MMMSPKSYIAAAGATTILVLTSLALAQDRSCPAEGGPRQGGPPQEAFDACDEASEGDECSVEINGRSNEGICRTPRGDDDRGNLLCVPNDAPRR